MISIKGSFDGIAVREFIFEEEGVDEHFLVNPLRIWVWCSGTLHPQNGQSKCNHCVQES